MRTKDKKSLVYNKLLVLSRLQGAKAANEGEERDNIDAVCIFGGCMGYWRRQDTILVECMGDFMQERVYVACHNRLHLGNARV